MVVGALRAEHADRPLVEHDVSERSCIRERIFVQQKDTHDHEEVEMSLDRAARDVDDRGRRGQQSQRDDRAEEVTVACLAPRNRRGRGQDRDHAARHERVSNSVGAGDGEDRIAGTCSQSKSRIARCRPSHRLSGSDFPSGSPPRIRRKRSRGAQVGIGVRERSRCGARPYWDRIVPLVEGSASHGNRQAGLDLKECEAQKTAAGRAQPLVQSRRFFPEERGF